MNKLRKHNPYIYRKVVFFIKKILIIISILISILCINQNYEKELIPDSAIRIRIIANSNSIDDQLEKLNVKSKVEEELYNDLKNINSISEARLEIKKNINKLDDILKKTSSTNYNINYGENFFPEKERYGIKYKEGNYESLVITLGEGKGNNWWCVLFPPLCTIEAEDKNIDNVEYKSKVLEILNDYK